MPSYTSIQIAKAPSCTPNTIMSAVHCLVSRPLLGFRCPGGDWSGESSEPQHPNPFNSQLH